MATTRVHTQEVPCSPSQPATSPPAVRRPRLRPAPTAAPRSRGNRGAWSASDAGGRGAGEGSAARVAAARSARARYPPADPPRAPPPPQLRGPREPLDPQRAAANRAGLLVAQSLHRLRIRAQLLLRALHAPLYPRARARPRQVVGLGIPR